MYPKFKRVFWDTLMKSNDSGLETTWKALRIIDKWIVSKSTDHGVMDAVLWQLRYRLDVGNNTDVSKVKRLLALQDNQIFDEDQRSAPVHPPSHSYAPRRGVNSRTDECRWNPCKAFMNWLKRPSGNSGDPDLSQRMFHRVHSSFDHILSMKCIHSATPIGIS